jgi:atlastin
MSGRGQPVQVVRLDKKSNGLELNIDALAEICLNEKCRERPLCVVSIAGDFRKGKSFMLNFFLRYLYHISDKQQALKDKQEKQEEEQDNNEATESKKSQPFYQESFDEDWLGNPDDELAGFSWRGGSKPETTGILVWDDPIVVTCPNGQEVAVLLMDTQGAFDSRQTIGQTAIIFALSTLTSSLQIYNVMNNIQEDNLQILDTFLAYGQLVLDKSSEKPFQELCFLVRDWRSPMDHSYGSEGGASLLKEKLELQDEDPESSDNKTRRRIESCFEKKVCFLMPYPGERVSVEEGGPFRGQISEMKQNFVDHLRVFVPQILSPKNLLVKKIGGEVVNGQSLLEYFRVYAETFKGEKIPEAKNLYDATAEASNLAAVANSKNYYLKSMKGICGAHKPFVNPKILEQKHNQLLKESLKMFENTKKLGEEDYSKTYSDNLMKELVSSFDEFVEMNNSKNMFNMWGSPLILLCFWFLAFTLSRIFELIGIGILANLFYFQATICFISIIVYLSMK